MICRSYLSCDESHGATASAAPTPLRTIAAHEPSIWIAAPPPASGRTAGSDPPLAPSVNDSEMADRFRSYHCPEYDPACATMMSAASCASSTQGGEAPGPLPALAPSD